MGPNPQFPKNLVVFTEEILNRKLYFCAVDTVTIFICNVRLVFSIGHVVFNEKRCLKQRQTLRG